MYFFCGIPAVLLRVFFYHARWYKNPRSDQYSFLESQVGIWTYPHGHSFLGDYHDDAKLVAALNDPAFREYLKALEAGKGADETARILPVRRWNSNVYPNLSFMSQFVQLRMVHPVFTQPHRAAAAAARTRPARFSSATCSMLGSPS